METPDDSSAPEHDPAYTLTPAQIASMLELIAQAHERIVQTFEAMDFAPLAAAAEASRQRLSEAMIESFSPDQQEIVERARASVDIAVNSMIANLPDLTSTLAPILQSIQSAAQTALAEMPDLSWLVPPNVRGVEGIDFESMTTWMKDEGLPIAHALDRETVRLVTAASDAAGRRDAIIRREREISDHMLEQLASVRDADLSYLASKLVRTITLLRSGDHDAAQALAASVLDTTLRNWRPGETRSITSHKDRDPDDLPIAFHFVICQVWGVYQQYLEERGDPIPTSFNRHATTHSVTPEQYTRENALLAVAHAVSLVLSVDPLRARSAASR